MNNFSKLGFILAAMGSSIGLGHIWRFPYMAGTSGGGAFVILFLCITFGIGVSMLIAEMVIGNRTKTNAQDAFKLLDESKGKRWQLASLSIIGGPMILTFYCIVLGWVLYYLFFISFSLPANATESVGVFQSLLNNKILMQIILFGVVIFLTGYFVARGVKSGIEQLNFVLMPLLFLIFIGLFIYAATLPSFSSGWHFMFDFDASKIYAGAMGSVGDFFTHFQFSQLDSGVLVNALGQALFSLSIGVGTIITYASATQEKQNLFTSAMWVVIPGILISLVAGVMIFTFTSEYGADPASGPGLVFITLPLVFAKMGTTGNIICVLFMIGLAFAGISSTVSLLEPPVKWFIDKTSFSRQKISWLLSLGIFLVGIILIFSLNEKTHLSLAGKNLFDWVDWISANFVLTLGALGSSLFVGWGIKKECLRGYTKHFFGPVAFHLWLFALRYLAPATIIFILVYNLFIKAN